MNNQEPQSRVKRYDFNKGKSNLPKRSGKQFRIWPWIVLLIVIIVVLVGGIKWFAGHDTSKPMGTTTSQQVSSSSTTTSSHHHTKDSSLTKSSKQSKNKQSSITKKHQQKNPNQPNNNSGTFAGDHQFGSVADAQSWAKATQNSWLNAGYTNYTISSDGQGFYILRFTR